MIGNGPKCAGGSPPFDTKRPLAAQTAQNAPKKKVFWFFLQHLQVCFSSWQAHPRVLEVQSLLHGGKEKWSGTKTDRNRPPSVLRLTRVSCLTVACAPSDAAERGYFAKRVQTSDTKGSGELRLFLTRWCFGEVCVACRSSIQLSKRANHWSRLCTPL